MLGPILMAAISALPFEPLPGEVLAAPELRQALAQGDMVVSRIEPGGSRAYTGLAMARASCDQVFRLLADPKQYVGLYPMVQEVEILRRSSRTVEYEMEIKAGPGSAERRLVTTLLPGRVIQTEQHAGRSTWHFFDIDAHTCLLHYTHDEDFTEDSTVLRMALDDKRAIVEGIKCAAAAGNVRHVRHHFQQRPAASAPRALETVVHRALFALSGVGTVAFLDHHDAIAVQVATRSRQSASRLLRAAAESERWRRRIPLFYGRLIKRSSSTTRRMEYRFASLFENIDFETQQRVGADRVDEKVVDGELDNGGWSWRVLQAPAGRALILRMQLQPEQGDWLVRQVTRYDPLARQGTSLGIAFLLVEKVAEQSGAGP